jgi:tol-pal system protein YbgF
MRNPLFLSQSFGGNMSLKTLSGIHFCLRQTWFVVLVLSAFLLVGCGGSEEATTEESQVQQAKPLGTVEQEKPTEEKPMDQALTSFVGNDTEKPGEVSKSDASTSTQLAQYEKQIGDLRTENTSLKQKMLKLEQENRGINARMSDVEARYAAEKSRADELAKGVAVTPQVAAEEKAPAPIMTKFPSSSGSMSTYEDALKAFNSRKYDDASKGFKAIVNSGANDDLTNRAKYWLGESYFAKKKYKEALPLFQDVLKFKNSEKKADAQFMVAQTYEHLGSKSKAKEAYEKVVKDYPMSKNIKRAKERWAKL